MFDLNLIPFSYKDGKEQAEMPGLYGVSAPRRAAHGRAQEQLVLFLNLQGTAPLSASGVRTLLERLAAVYFQTSGSVTAALRATAETLNKFLLERNLKSSASGRQTIGALNIAVIHSGSLYLAQCGAVHAFLINPQAAVQYHDAQAAQRALGLTRTTAVRYYQTEPTAGQYLLLCTDPPPSWNTAALGGSPAGSLEGMRRRLLSQGVTDLTAALVQVLPGSGKTIQAPLLVKPTPAAAPAPGIGNRREEQTRPSPAPSASSQTVPAAVDPQPIPVVQPPTAAAASFQPAAEQPSVGAPVQDGVVSPPPEAILTAAGPKTVEPPSPAPEKPAPELKPAADLSKKTALPPTQPAPAAASSALPTAHRRNVRRTGFTLFKPKAAEAPAPTTAPSTPPPAARRKPRQQGFSLFKSKTAQVPLQKVSGPTTNPDGEPVIQEMKRSRQSFASKSGSVLLRSAGAVLRGLSSLRQAAGNFLRTVGARLLPGTSEQLPALSTATMIFMAIAVPVIVVAVALVVYNDRGRGEYYQVYYAQAVIDADKAASLTETEAIRAAWKEALAQVDKAETYRKTDDTQALRLQAWNALDQLDGVQRLDFQPIVAGGAVAKDANITKIAATANELYMLDGAQGRVLHAVKTGHGYDLDPEFSCGPGGSVGALVDIVLLPVTNKFKATLAAIDANGNFMYCLPGSAPVSFALTPPDINWGGIVAMTLDSGTLYVLDPRTNTIYYYDLNADSDYRDPPKKLFETPPSISDSIDLAINGNEVYILHVDGHLTECTVNDPNIAPSRCSDPAVFSDFRPGKDASPTGFQGTAFSKIIYTPPPEPSIYILDENGATIYHFSVRLRLQRLMGARSAVLFDQTNPRASAFAISSNHTAFMAWGNRVYYAYIP